MTDMDNLDTIQSFIRILWSSNSYSWQPKTWKRMTFIPPTYHQFPAFSLPGSSNCSWGRKWGVQQQSWRQWELLGHLQAQLQECQRETQQTEKKKGGGRQRCQREVSQVRVSGQFEEISLPLLCGRKPTQLWHEMFLCTSGSVPSVSVWFIFIVICFYRFLPLKCLVLQSILCYFKFSTSFSQVSI